MTRKLSNWSEPGQKPPRAGVWETCATQFGAKYYQHWNGMFYGLCSPSIEEAYENRSARTDCPLEETRFRGLATKPEENHESE